jgi:4-hydroxy-tetrahydrodipicolinate synthase
VIEALAVTTNPIPVKAALALLGHDVGGLRLPLVEASDEERALIRETLERTGVLAVARALG